MAQCVELRLSFPAAASKPRTAGGNDWLSTVSWHFRVFSGLSHGCVTMREQIGGPSFNEERLCALHTLR